MPKTRRGGRKYHLRKIIAQLYAPPSRNHLLGVDYNCDCETESSRVLHQVDFPRYELTPIEVTTTAIHPSIIPESDPRYKVYTATATQDQDQQVVSA